MIIDKELMYNDPAGQSIIATADSQVKNHVKAGFPFKKMFLLVLISEVFNNLTSLTISYRTSDDNFAADDTEVFTKTVPVAELTLGAKALTLPVPSKMKQYSKLTYTVTGAAPTTGAVKAQLVESIEETYHG